MVTSRASALASLLVALLSLAGCGDGSTPKGDFYDFLSRADRTPADVGALEQAGLFTDISGAWLFNVDLRPLGDVQLELRVTVTDFIEGEMPSDPARLLGTFHFPDDPIDAEPLTTWESEYSIDGRFAIRSGFVRIEADRSPIEDTAVEVEFILDVIVLDEATMCGQVTDPDSVTFLPIVLELPGTTFGAEAYDATGPPPTDVPLRCPFAEPDPADAGGGADDADAGGAADGGAGLLAPPDVDFGPGSRSDIGGRFWVVTAIPAFPLGLEFIADLTYREGESEAAIDGTLRVDSAAPGAPAAGVFTTTVDDDGVFDVVIEGLVAEGSVTVEANVALRGQIQDADTFCGVATGEVFAPIPLSLEGTTFGAVRIADDATSPPETTLDMCP